MLYQGSFQNGKELHAMSEKRRDNRGRILRTGESQRKDGRYAYKYTDAYGKPQFVYSWKLVATDKTPAGKRDVPALRDKVKEICRDLDDGIDTIGKKMTVCQLYAKQNGLRKNVKHGTEKNREYLMSLLQDDPIGMKSIDTVKQSDAKEWVIRMSCVARGASDTTFYILAVYFGSVGITKTRNAVTCGLIADFSGIIAAIIISYLFFF